mmetsp:Transcript_10342/g.22762  ORF Transcript_10342/g.22762 Transcript_10342/m.22762 type:complete len:1423 (+) Transcript_10342:125-4393(+)
MANLTMHKRGCFKSSLLLLVMLCDVAGVASMVTTKEMPAQRAQAFLREENEIFSKVEARRLETEPDMACAVDKAEFDPLIHKTTYRIAVHAVRGLEQAEREFKPLAEYLTATVGQRFERMPTEDDMIQEPVPVPITFEVMPVDYSRLLAAVQNEEADFFHANPGIFSCVGVELGAEALATVVKRLTVRGLTFDLDVYGGVIFTQADRTDIERVEDLKDKVIGAGGIDDLMAGPLPFSVMQSKGMSYVMDPAEVVFTHDQDKVVRGVLSREFDVGFVRTEQIERTIDDQTGELIDPNVFKVLEPKIYVLPDGNLFPFLHSTDIYPEWPIAALTHVPDNLAHEVLRALLAFEEHLQAGEEVNNGGDWQNTTRCDASPLISSLAQNFADSGSVAGFRNARSYFQVRSMQEDAGFLLLDEESDDWSCTRADSLYDTIQCPEGHYKLPFDEYERSCEDQGLGCQDGYDCFCRPCVAAHEVDVVHFDNGIVEGSHCDKMSVCGVVEQTKNISFLATDNRQRVGIAEGDDGVEVGATLSVVMHVGNQEPYQLDVIDQGDFTYEFTWSHNEIGVGVMEVYINGEQIPDSPIRVQVIERMCDLEFPGEDKANSANGDCVCKDSTIQMGTKCISTTVIAVVISGGSALILAIIGLFYLRYRNFKNDQMWQVNVDELHLDDPPEVVGSGSFGVVILAEYRGTKVAIKRVRTAAGGSKHSKRGQSSRGHSASMSKQRRKTKKNRASSSSGPGSDRGDKVEDTTNSLDGSLELNDAQSDVDVEMANNKGLMSTDGASGIDADGYSYSLGFLAADYGRNQGRFARFLPWGGDRYSQQNRFRATILSGSGNSRSTDSKKSMFDYVFPWCSKRVQAEEEFISEMRILSRLRHPCITTVMGAVISHSHDPMLVMEYMEYGSLYELLRNESMHLSGDVIMQVTRDTVQGLRYLHSSKPPILHGDLKGRNILIDSRFRAKLCDFGLSTKNKNFITGTPYWLAPEYLRGQSGYTTACDVYSVAIIFYEIYSRKTPYEGEDLRDTLRKVCDRRVNKRPDIPSSMPPKMVEVMKKCWSPKPEFRPDAKELDNFLFDTDPRDAEPLLVDDPHSQRKNVRATGDMLYQLFPKHVADALKHGQKVEPEQHDMVSIVFSDIVNFTSISRELTPLKVSQMLDRLFLAYDKMAQQYNVFKVETIGDAYMGVTNLTNQQEHTHAKQAALFAIGMVREASKILIDEEDPSKGHLRVRVGLHSGPVVSNVIGSLNPRYSLVGDTVNNASHMESSSKAQRVLCSEKAQKLLQEQAPEIKLVRRGKLAVKGKGDMDVYWVGGVSSHKEPAREGPKKIVGFLESDAVEEKMQKRDLIGLEDSLHQANSSRKNNNSNRGPLWKFASAKKTPPLSESASCTPHTSDQPPASIEVVDEPDWKRDLRLGGSGDDDDDSSF